MFCTQCGREAAPDTHFCANCGRAFAAQTMPQPAVHAAHMPQNFPENRVQNHIRVLGVLWIVFGVLRVLPLLWLWFVSHAILPSVLGSYVPGYSMGSPLSRIIEAGLIFASVLFILQAALAFFAGWGLLAWQSWGRIVGIIAAVFSLWEIPFGTALGIYALWVLLPASSDLEYRNLARV